MTAGVGVLHTHNITRTTTSHTYHYYVHTPHTPPPYCSAGCASCTYCNNQHSGNHAAKFHPASNSIAARMLTYVINPPTTTGANRRQHKSIRRMTVCICVVSYLSVGGVVQCVVCGIHHVCGVHDCEGFTRCCAFFLCIDTCCPPPTHP